MIKDMLKKSIIKGYRLEAKFSEGCLNYISGIPASGFYESSTKYFLNGEGSSLIIPMLNPLISYGKFMYRLKHPNIIIKTKKIRESIEVFHDIYGLRLETS